MAELKTDMQEVKKTLSLFKPGNELIEIRMFKNKFTTSGYFKGDYMNLLKGFGRADYDNCYFVLNEIKDECYSREQHEKYISGAKTTTADKEISRRCWILIDCDPKRASGISSTDEEKAHAGQITNRVYEYLRRLGFSAPICADSGNGNHLLYRIDLPNEPSVTELIKSFLKALDMMFSDDKASIDTSVFNAARITKLYGTVARKGANTSERPYRLSRIIRVPDEIKLTDIELIKKVADMLPKPPPKQEYKSYRGGQSSQFDINDFIQKYLRVSKTVNVGDYTKYLLEKCPFDSSHESPDSMVTVSNNGALGFKCLHASCADKKWEDVRKLYEPKAEHQQNSTRKSSSKQQPNEDIFDEFDSADDTNIWENPVPFANINLPAFPVNELPVIISDYIRAVAETTLTAPDMAAVASLTTVALCLQGKFEIEGKKDYNEQLNLYAAIVADSGEYKSPVLKHISAPVIQFEREENERLAPLIEENNIEYDLLMKQKTALIKSKKDVDKAEIRELSRQIAEFEFIKKCQIYADDVTPETLASILHENDGRTSVISSEGGIFDILAGRYSNGGANIDTFLKAWSGDNIKVNRRGRYENVPNPALTMLLFVQPLVIQTFMENGEFKGRGLCGRFLYCLPPSRAGTRNFKSPAIPEIHKRRYFELINKLLKYESKEPRVIKLSEAAEKAYIDFWQTIETNIIDESNWFKDFINKFRGQVLRIAGLLYIANEMPLNGQDELILGEGFMRSAIKIGEYFLEHARAAYQLMGTDENQKNAEYILKKIIDKKLEQFKKSQIFHFCRKFKSVDELTDPLAILVKHNYLKEVPQEYNGVGRQPENIYLVNPYIL